MTDVTLHASHTMTVVTMNVKAALCNYGPWYAAPSTSTHNEGWV